MTIKESFFAKLLENRLFSKRNKELKNILFIRQNRFFSRSFARIVTHTIKFFTHILHKSKFSKKKYN